MADLGDQELVFWVYLIHASNVIHELFTLDDPIELYDLRVAGVCVLELEVHYV